MYLFVNRVLVIYLLVIGILCLKISVEATGTVQPIAPFDAGADAEKLHDALTKGDDGLRDLADLVSTRSCDQRLEMKKSFEQNFCLLDTFTPKPFFYGDLGYQFLPSCFKCGATLYAYHVYDRYGKGGLATKTELIEILLYCSKTAELHDLCLSEYKMMYSEDLGELLDKELHDDFHNVVMEMIHRKRAAQSPSDATFIQNTAQALLDEKKKWEKHRQALDGAFFELSLDVLPEVMKKFMELNDNQSFADAVTGITETETYQTIYSFIVNPIKFYAQMIGISLHNKVLREQLLMRVVLMTSETNLAEIKLIYQQEYNENLQDRLEQTEYIKNTLDYKTKLYGFLKYPLP